jgi:hypothetical protein
MRLHVRITLAANQHPSDIRARAGDLTSGVRDGMSPHVDAEESFTP